MVSDSDADRVVQLMTSLRQEAEQSDRLVKRAVELALDPSDRRASTAQYWLSSLLYHLDGFHGAIERLEAEIGDAG